MKNRLKAILRRDEVALGMAISIGHPDVADLCGWLVVLAVVDAVLGFC